MPPNNWVAQTTISAKSIPHATGKEDEESN